MSNPTTPFSWQMPTATDLVTDLPADFEVFGQAVATSMADLLGGTSGQVLAKNSNTDMDFVWVTTDDTNAIQNAIVDAKGDLIAATAADTPARLAVGANGTSLVADSSAATGLAYASRATLAGNTFTADQNVNGLVVGRSAGNISTNAALGQAALGANTTGTVNVAVGNYALGANTTGTNNNAVGNDALRYNTTASSNNAFGSNALAANTTGTVNAAFGNYALAANTTGSNNNAVGADALRFNTTGGINSAFGNNALNTNTTGGENVAVGHYALYNNTTASYNVAMGSNAAAANTTGTTNTAIGTEALRLNTTGSSNTTIGRSSLYNVSTGGTNTGVGFEAGAGLTTGSNNTFVGNNALPSSATVSNTITLGNSSIATLRCQVTSITSLSDERDKTDISPLEHGLDFVKQLKPVSFEWNTRPETRIDFEGNKIEVLGKVGIADIGFIAQDIVALEDSLGAADTLQLSFRDNPEKLEVTQGRLIPILVKAIQDLTAKVEALEAAQA